MRTTRGPVDPMREVSSSSWESVPKSRRGYIVGTQVRWTLVLTCGHVTKRSSSTGSLKAPKKARCLECGLAAAEKSGSSSKAPAVDKKARRKS